ncbi:MAG: TonB-dependent receptor [Verrucomicrobiota bacterium]
MRMLPSLVCSLGTLLVPSVLSADESRPAGPVETLPEMRVVSPRVANQEPAGTFAMPISALTFEPLVDVQARNLAEGQADVSIRGGTFENTGFSIGALPVYDPQTGHYFAELPVAPAMLGSPDVRTGSANSLAGWNATAGSVAYGWMPVRNGGQVSAGAGDNNLLRGDVHAGVVAPRSILGRTVGADVNFATSQGEGSRSFGEHDFLRANARLQFRDDASQTDLFAGHQSKAFSWVNLYAPFNRQETEDVRTDLFIANHRVTTDADGGFFQIGGYYRANRDTYTIPAFAFENNHKTLVRGLALDGRAHVADATAVLYRAGLIEDDIDSRSTSPTGALVFGRFDDRVQVYAGVAVEQTFALSADRDLVVTLGTQFDDSNRHESELSPSAKVELRQSASVLRGVYLSYDETTQVPTYQALNANVGAGLFRGDPNLPRATAQNLELGAELAGGDWTWTSAVFARRDDELLDYIYDPTLPPTTARSAVSGDLTTVGFETFARRNGERLDVVLGYTLLHKDEDYLAANQASFYAYNFAEHRLTAALVWRVTGDLELRMDNEYRIQKENTLRRRNDEPLLSALGLVWRVPGVAGLSLNAQVDNLWNTYYEEVPQVPGARRTWSVGAAYVW